MRRCDLQQRGGLLHDAARRRASTLPALAQREGPPLAAISLAISICVIVISAEIPISISISAAIARARSVELELQRLEPASALAVCPTSARDNSVAPTPAMIESPIASRWACSPSPTVPSLGPLAGANRGAVLRT